MSIPAELGGDALSTFVSEVEGSLDRLKRSLAEDPYPCGSRALAFAVASGLRPRMTYTVAQTASYLGIDEGVLRAEIKAGRLSTIIPAGKERGARISVDEVDRWFEEQKGRAA